MNILEFNLEDELYGLEVNQYQTDDSLALIVNVYDDELGKWELCDVLTLNVKEQGIIPVKGWIKINHNFLGDEQLLNEILEKLVINTDVESDMVNLKPEVVEDILNVYPTISGI